MLRGLQYLATWQRRLVFFLIFVGGLLLLAGITWFLIRASLFGGRAEAFALADGVRVATFATLPDDDSYPASLAISGDTVYSASYATGAVWRIDADGRVRELPGTRDAIGAAAGMIALPDGSLLVVDEEDTDYRTRGGRIVRVAPDGAVSIFAGPPDTDVLLAPDDIAIDSAGRVYVTDRGQSAVWRFDSDGTNGVLWWSAGATTPTPDATAEATTDASATADAAADATPGASATADATADRVGALTGIAYDAASDALIVTDPETNTLYRVQIADARAEPIYTHTNDGRIPPGFDGVAVAPDGTVYVAALGQNALVRVDADGTLQYIAGRFRGASDVVFAAPDRLIVTNWDQTSLANPFDQPQLPFTLDVVTLPPDAAAGT